MDVDDSSETETDETDDGENDDYVEGEEEKKKQQLQSKQQQNEHDRLDGDDNEINMEKPTKLSIPYWDPYDTVNQLFLEISK